MPCTSCVLLRKPCLPGPRWQADGRPTRHDSTRPGTSRWALPPCGWCCCTNCVLLLNAAAAAKPGLRQHSPPLLLSNNVCKSASHQPTIKSSWPPVIKYCRVGLSLISASAKRDQGRQGQASCNRTGAVQAVVHGAWPCRSVGTAGWSELAEADARGGGCLGPPGGGLWGTLAHSERAFQARSNFLLTGTHYATQAVRTLC